MKFQRTLMLIILTAAVLLVVAPVLANAVGPEVNVGPGAAASTAVTGQVQPGNYCISCHVPGDARIETGAAWNGGIERQQYSPCPASVRMQEELYYTERLLLAIDRSRAGLPAGADVQKIDARLDGAVQTYSRLLDTNTGSMDAYVSEAQTLRYRLGKIYTELNQASENLKIRNQLVAAVLVTLFILFSLGWGLKNTQSIHKGGPRVAAPAFLRPSVPGIVLLVVILVLFSLPLFRPPAAEVVTPTAEEQASQAALDTAQRAASASDRALARAWMLSRVGASETGLSQADQQAVLEETLTAVRQVQMSAAALWGGAQSAHEVNAGSRAGQEKAYLVGAQLDSARSRAWGLRMVAMEWAAVDYEKARLLLEDALTIARTAPAAYRDLDTRAIAVVYAGFDLDRAQEIAAGVSDPALRAWAFREIAAVGTLRGSGDALQAGRLAVCQRCPSGVDTNGIYVQAVEAARLVEDGVTRARLLGEIASQSGNTGLFQEALSALDGLAGAQLAYALSDLAANSGDRTLADGIDAAYPGARAYAYYRLALYGEAWQAAAAIYDPYERAQAQYSIAAASQNVSYARTMEIQTLKDRALSALAVSLADPALAGEISSAYYRVQAYTGLGNLQAAWDAAGDLDDGYPLVHLGVAMSHQDPQRALALVDRMDREADKAQVLTALAAATGDPETFERALGMAMAARVRGDALAPAEASLSLSKLMKEIEPKLGKAALQQALEIARRISIK